MKHSIKLQALAVFSLLYTAESTAELKKNEELNEIVVYGEHNKSLTSIQTVSNKEMQKTPVNNMNITDYLRTNPHIRYENSDINSFQQGEIKPDNISINGADFNQTAYFVDNVNINDDLTVDSEVFDGAMQTVPGISHTQAYFFDASMLSKVEVQDSNISASLGGFTGGAVIAKTKQYSGKDSVILKYRTTHSRWNSLQVDKNAEKILSEMRPASNGAAELQPKYHKQQFSITAEKGISDNLGLVLGFSRRQSAIAQNRLIGISAEDEILDKQNHHRLSDNILLNMNWTPTIDDRFELSGRYSKYLEKKYFTRNLDNNVSDYHNAYGLTLAWVHAFKNGVLTNTFAYDLFSDKRTSSSSNIEIVSVFNEDFDPIYDYEKGGYGNSKLLQNNIHFSTEYALDPIKVNWGSHSISLGAIYQSTNYKFNRPQDVHSKVIQQYVDFPPIIREDIAPKGNAKVNYQNIALYVEDLITLNKLELRPGIRFERDDYLKNNNFAPRFVSKYSFTNNSSVTLGVNRYYGRSFSSLKLTDKILQINNDTSRKHQKFSHLKTPYTNEFSSSLNQNWKNIALQLSYIHRQYKDRIILKKDTSMYPSRSFYTNADPFSVDIYSLQLNNIDSWKLGMTHWNAFFAIDISKTKRADLGNGINPNDIVILDGKQMTRRMMENKVNASMEDWIARIGLDMNIPKSDITWANRVYIKSPIRGYNEIDVDDPIPHYRSFDFGKHIQWDTSIRWQPKVYNKHSIYFQFDILNVLNKTRKNRSIKSISTSDEYGIYTPGREYWLEVGYEF